MKTINVLDTKIAYFNIELHFINRYAKIKRWGFFYFIQVKIEFLGIWE